MRAVSNPTKLGEEWTEESVGSLCGITHGFAFSGAEFSSDVPQGNPIVITPGNFTEDGKLIFNDKNTKRFTGDAPTGFRFDIGDLVVVMTDLSSKMKILGKPAFVETDDVLHNQRIGRVVFLNGRIKKRFLYYFMMDERYLQNIRGSATGTMVKHTAPKRILSNRIVFPVALKAQRRIVGILDEAFDGIATAKANAEKNLQNARALFESDLNAVFAQRGDGWADKRKPLAELCELIVDCEHKTAPTQEKGIPSIRTPNIRKGKLLLEGVNRVSEATYKAWTRRAEPLPGDLILAREAPAGNVALIPENARVCLGQRTVLIRPKCELFNPAFLAFLLLEPNTQAKLLAHSRGATVQHVNMKDIRALNVGAIPSLRVQESVVATLSSLDEETERLESIYQRKLNSLDELKKSLLHQAFSGQL